MKKLLPLLFLTLSLFGQTNVQKDKDKKLSNGSIVVGDGVSITATGTGVIAATSIPGLTIATTAPLTGGGSLASNLTLSIPAATNSVNGYLTSADHTTFAAKQAPGNYITALTGDATAAGPGSSALTLATVNANVGTFAGLVINGKGLVTGATVLTTLAGYGITDGVNTTSNDTNVTGSVSGHTLTLGWAGTLAAGRLNPNVVQGTTNDINVIGSITAQILTFGWTGTLAADRLNSNVVQSVTNDTNVTGSIATQALTLGWSGQLAVARGGTGAGTLTGVVLGNGTSAFTTAGLSNLTLSAGTLSISTTYPGQSSITTVGTLTSGAIGSGFTVIPNSALANSAVTIGSTSIALGSTSTTLAGVTSIAGLTTITGGASNMTIVAGTGNSRTITLQTTTSGGTATSFLTGAADQSATFASVVNVGSTTDATASSAALLSNGGITALKKIWAGTGGFVGASITSPTTSDLTVVAANSGASIVAQHGTSGNLVVRPGGTLGSGTEGWVDLGGPTWTSGASDGAYSYPLRWGVGNGFGLVGGFQNFTGIEDNAGGISYNPKHVAGDISVGLAFESRYLASTETYLAWTSADGLTSTRPFQSNIDWGPSYGGTTTGATIWRFDVDEFHIYARTQVGGASPLTMNMSATAGASTFAWQGGMQLFNAYLQAQATTPATPGDGNRIYSDSGGRFTLLNAAGFTTTIQNATANAVFSFPTTGGGLLVDNGNVTPNTGRYYSGADSSGGAQFATRVDKNGATLGVEVQNNSATTAASAGVQINNGTHVGGITQYGESFTTSGANIAGSTQLYTNSTLVLNAINGHIQIFAGNPAKEMAYLDPQFGFIVGRAGGTYANWGTSGITFNSSTGITWTRSGSAGTDATAVFNSFGQPTLAASNATTTTNAATLYIAGDVVQGTNQTLTNSYGFWNAGKTRLDGVASVRDNLQIDTAGKTILVKSGSNAAAGTVTLVAGAATITSTAIDANTVILFSEKTAGGTPGVYQPLAAVSSGSAAVTSAATDISTYNWVALKVN